MATNNQLSFLRDLVLRHPNFRKTYEFGGEMYNENPRLRYLYDDDHNEIGKTDEFCAAWVNEKYGDYIIKPIHYLDELSIDEASALITHLKLGEQERNT